MNDIAAKAPQPTLHELFVGGFYAGRIRVADAIFAIVVAPRDAGEISMSWGPANAAAGAYSFFDGRANTQAMAAGGSKLAQWALDLAIGGFTDWYLPSRDELELCYRAFKPGTYENWCYRGDNPSSVPVGYAYAPDDPAQTTAKAFRAKGAEAFAENWYWTSTAYRGDAGSAWCQYFLNGYQLNYLISDELRARAVRRVEI